MWGAGKESGQGGESDLDNDTLSFSEFRMWYNSGAGKQVLPWVDALSW